MSEIKIGDRVHARFSYCDGVAIGTVTAIERSAGATVYCVLVDEAETPSRATAAWLVEVTTAENLHAALARCTEERDRARRDRDYWTLLASQHLEWGRGLERERNEARKKLEGSLAREESLKISREEALVKRDALAKERAEVAKERDFWRALAGERYERMQAFEAERDALYRHAAQLAGLLRAEGDEP